MLRKTSSPLARHRFAMSRARNRNATRYMLDWYERNGNRDEEALRSRDVKLRVLSVIGAHTEHEELPDEEDCGRHSTEKCQRHECVV